MKFMILVKSNFDLEAASSSDERLADERSDGRDGGLQRQTQEGQRDEGVR